MVPMPRYSTVAGIPITELLPQERIDALVERTANGGAEIVGLLKTGSAYYAPLGRRDGDGGGHLQGQTQDSSLRRLSEGEYGVDGLFVGVPVKLGRNGIEEIVQIDLRPEEDAALKKSAAAVKELVEIIKV